MIKEWTLGEQTACVKGFSFFFFKCEEWRRIIVRAIENRTGRHSDLMSSFRKLEVFTVFCLCYGADCLWKLCFSTLCKKKKKSEVHFQKNWETILALCLCINHSDIASTFTQRVLCESKMLKYNLNLWWRSTKGKTLVWLFLFLD